MSINGTAYWQTTAQHDNHCGLILTLPTRQSTQSVTQTWANACRLQCASPGCAPPPPCDTQAWSQAGASLLLPHSWSRRLPTHSKPGARGRGPMEDSQRRESMGATGWGGAEGAVAMGDRTVLTVLTTIMGDKVMGTQNKALSLEDKVMYLED